MNNDNENNVVLKAIHLLNTPPGAPTHTGPDAESWPSCGPTCPPRTASVGSFATHRRELNFPASVCGIHAHFFAGRFGAGVIATDCIT